MSPLLAGCYATVPLDGGKPSVGSDLVLRLNDRGTTQLASQVGPRVVKIEGRLLSLPVDSLAVAVRSTTMMNGEENFWKGERIAAANDYVAFVEQKKLSTFRSAVVGLAVAGAAFAIRSVAGGSTSGPNPNPPPGRQ